jgi:hypothetical protein
MSAKGHVSADDKVVDEDLSSVSVEVLVSTYVMRFKCYFHLLIWYGLVLFNWAGLKAESWEEYLELTCCRCNRGGL